MQQELWDQIGQLFDEALKRSGAEREGFLSDLGEEGLEEEVRSLLSVHESRGRFDELADYVTGPEVQRLLRLAPGDQLGPYRIVREIGSGGMATVYLARDLKHERQVAVKVLGPTLAAVLGADRFDREIMTTAKLQHSHILPLLDSGQADGLLYYVMPFIEGETLREKLNRERQLGVEEAVRITADVADALDYAHRNGVVHRDIKPENILLQEGRPLVADFGIALAMSAVAGERTTDAGLLLGTPHYMSPEQATAEKHLTHRSDIYSLGCVLYEMLTGNPPHTGSSAQQIIPKIVTDEARPITELRKSVPSNVAAAAAVSLEKLPADRFDSAATFAKALEDPTFSTPAAGIASGIARSRDRWRQLAAGLAAMAVIAVFAGVWDRLGPAGRGANSLVAEFYLDPPSETMFFGGDLALSPDGERLVAEILTEEGSVLYERMLDSRDWRVIPGTEGATAPFFSPDGEWLGFFSRREEAIKRMPVSGGPVQTITQVAWIGGASWGPDNTVVFSATEDPSSAAPPTLLRVGADGGVPERLPIGDTILHQGLVFDPSHLASGDVVLFNVGGVPSFVAALSLESGTVSRLATGMTPMSDRSDRVIYVTPEGSAVAQKLNRRTLELEGSPQPIAQGLKMVNGVYAPYAISSTGSLAYLAPSAGENRLLLVDREGEARPLYAAGVGSLIGSPRFSPTGDHIAFGQDADVWVYSIDEGTARRLSFEGPYACDPAWTSDGRSIGYSVAAGSDRPYASIFLRPADGTGSAEEVLTADGDLWEVQFAPGDREVVLFSVDNVYRASLVGDSRLVPLLETESYVANPSLSSDGRWIAYRSNESGGNEVYARSYPDMGPPTIVSVGGGAAPAWSPDGREIFFWGSGRMNAASVRPDGARLTVTRHSELFDAGPFQQGWTRNYDVHPDGQEFVTLGRPHTRVVWRTNALPNEP